MSETYLDLYIDSLKKLDNKFLLNNLYNLELTCNNIYIDSNGIHVNFSNYNFNKIDINEEIDIYLNKFKELINELYNISFDYIINAKEILSKDVNFKLNISNQKYFKDICNNFKILKLEEFIKKSKISYDILKLYFEERKNKWLEEHNRKK